MNYNVLKMIVQFVLAIILLMVLKKIKNCSIKNSRIIAIVGICLIVFLSIFPIYFYLFSFKSLESAFNFYQPSGKIIRKYEYDSYAYILYEDNKYSNMYCFVKKNGSWNLDNVLNKGMPPLDIKDILRYHIYIKYNPSKSTKALMIQYSLFDNENIEGQTISDSLNSEFTTISKKDSLGITVTHTVILDNNIDSKYTIYINNDIIKPFDYTLE